MSSISGSVNAKMTEIGTMIGGTEEAKENVMAEVGLELLLKEPVIKKSDRKMLNEGGPKAVKFYLELLKKIQVSENQFHKYKKAHMLDFPTKFFL